MSLSFFKSGMDYIKVQYIMQWGSIQSLQYCFLHLLKNLQNCRLHLDQIYKSSLNLKVETINNNLHGISKKRGTYQIFDTLSHGNVCEYLFKNLEPGIWCSGLPACKSSHKLWAYSYRSVWQMSSNDCRIEASVIHQSYKKSFGANPYIVIL